MIAAPIAWPIATPIASAITAWLSSAFNPLSYFAGGEKGVWLEAADKPTLFQDFAGTTPVTAPGQPVGLWLDKSKGLESVPLTIPTFSFTVGTSATTVSQAGNVLTFNAAPSGDRASAIGVYGIATLGKVVFTATGTGTIAVYVGNASSIYSPSAVQQTHERFTSGGSLLHFVAGTGGFTGTVTIHSVSEKLGNHFTQPTAGKRPMYVRFPAGGTRNLLTYTEDFSNATWSKIDGASVTQDAATAPDGTLTADRLQLTASNVAVVQQLYVRENGAALTYTASVYLKSNTGSPQNLRLKCTHTGVLDNFLPITVTTEWQRFEFTVTNGASAGIGQYLGVVNGSAGGVKDVLVWGGQMELASTATAYQKVVSSADVTEAGVADVWAVKGDGVDDFMSSAAIDFTATDKMTVWAGVRKISDAASATVLGNNTSVGGVGSFEVFAPNTAIQSNGVTTFSCGSPYTASANASKIAAAPVSLALTGQYDISGDSVKLSINGDVPSSSSVEQGSGNFANRPMYLLSREGINLFFNGPISSYIARGAATDAAGITNGEKWTSKRIGVTLP